MKTTSLPRWMRVPILAPSHEGQSLARHQLCPRCPTLLEAEVGETRHAPMTADWWIALSLEELEGAHVVTDDKGPEWEHLRQQGRVLTAEEVFPWLAQRATA